MTEIVERLREHADREAGGGPSEPNYDPETLTLEHEAADEIERMHQAILGVIFLIEAEHVRFESWPGANNTNWCAACSATTVWPCREWDMAQRLRELVGPEPRTA